MKAAFWLATFLFLSGCATSGGENTSSPEKRAQIYTALGVAYLQQGQTRAAVQEFNKAIEIDSRAADAHSALGLAYQQLNQPELAAKAFREALDISPHAPGILNNYGAFLLSQGKYGEAEKALRQALADPLYPTPQFAYLNLAKVHAARGDQQQARADLNRALEIQPNFAPALLQLAILDYAEGNLPAAESEVELALAQMPTDLDARLLAGQVARDRKRYEEARRHFQQVIDQAPFSPQGRRAQSLLLQLP